LSAYLREQAINISFSKYSSALIDFERRGIRALARASTHYYNDESEIERFVAALKAV